MFDGEWCGNCRAIPLSSKAPCPSIMSLSFIYKCHPMIQTFLSAQAPTSQLHQQGIRKEEQKNTPRSLIKKLPENHTPRFDIITLKLISCLK